MIVVFSVFGVVCSLAFFMTVVMGWDMGALEVLGLIVFVGYSITYSLHIAHKYAQHTRASATADSEHVTRRDEAVKHALLAMTSAVAGSAVTTLGASFFLFFCTLSIFVRLAAVLFAVTFFALSFALVALPAALLVVGPMGRLGCAPIVDCLKNRGRGHTVGLSQRDIRRYGEADEEEKVGLSPKGQSQRSLPPKSEVFIAPPAGVIASPVPSPYLTSATAKAIGQQPWFVSQIPTHGEFSALSIMGTPHRPVNMPPSSTPSGAPTERRSTPKRLSQHIERKVMSPVRGGGEEAAQLREGFHPAPRVMTTMPVTWCGMGTRSSGRNSRSPCKASPTKLSV